MEGDNVLRKLAAIFYADVAGYSRLTGEDEEGTHRTLASYLDFMAEMIASSGGRVVHYAGDAVLADFSSVVAAVNCAIRIQEELGNRNADIPEGRRVEFRIGVNLGDVIVDRGDIYGNGVNIAARLESIADPGGICIGGAVLEHVQGKVAAQFQDMGSQVVKNIAKPVAAYRVVIGSPQNSTAPHSASDRPSIAVLPFANLSAEREQEFFADGMTEDVITELSRFNDLFVVARNSSYAFKDKQANIKDIARELGVHFILEGSVRKTGNRVRINVQLINARAGNHIWAERYDGALEDVFDLQEQVTRQVVGSILPQINQAQWDRVNRGEQVFDAAHELAWRAQAMRRAAMLARDADMLDRAIWMAMDAVSANPKCSIAYQVLCLGNSMKNLFRWGQNAEEAGKVAEEWAEKYFSQLPENYMAYFCLAMARFRLGRYQDALRDFRYAHERNVNDSVVLRYLAWCEASMGELNEAKIHAEMAIRLSPKDPTVHVAHLALAMAAFVEGDGAAFEIYCQRAIQGAPYAPIRRALMIAYAAEKGDERLMRVHREELMRNSPNFVSSLFRGENRLFQDPEHMALLLNGLRKAGFS